MKALVAVAERFLEVGCSLITSLAYTKTLSPIGQIDLHTEHDGIWTTHHIIAV